MTALGIRYLRGYSVANDVAKQRPEWPPHPGRVFMALAAAYFDTGEDARERGALEWLEREGSPAIAASECFERSFVESYVPVNDGTGGIVSRGRQPRSFATVRPERDSVFLIWPAEAPADVRTGLERLCGKVTRVGHSSSVVQMWVSPEEATPEPNWLPDDRLPQERMRVASEGTLAYLERAFSRSEIERYASLEEAFGSAKGKEKARLKKELADGFPDGPPTAARPVLSTWQGYAAAREPSEKNEPTIPSPFDPELLIFGRFDGNALPLESTLSLTGAMRDTAMSACGTDVPEWLSGHTKDGAPSLAPHVAFFSLPYVGAEYADGHLLGVAMAIPRSVPASELKKALGPLLFHDSGAEKQLYLWRKRADEFVWKWTLERETRAYPPVALRRQTWTRASRVWASVTPVVLHHHPKNNRPNDVERIVREAFVSASLPQPHELSVQSVSSVFGAGHALGMPRFDDKGKGLSTYQVHVRAIFEQPVLGPVLVGRGRFRGYGLFRPESEDRNGNA